MTLCNDSVAPGCRLEALLAGREAFTDSGVPEHLSSKHPGKTPQKV
jgi:hypothetical protein